MAVSKSGYYGCCFSVMVMIPFLAACSNTKNSASKDPFAEETVIRSAGLGLGETPNDAIEKSIKTCLNRSGFEYHGPNPLSGGPATFQRMDTEDFVKKWGYGVSTQYDVRKFSLALPSELRRDLAIDPKTGAETPYMKELRVCQEKVYKQQYGGLPEKSIKQGSKLKDALLKLKYSADFSEQQREWSLCLKSQGHSYEELEQPADAISQELFPLLNPDADFDQVVTELELEKTESLISKLRKKELDLAKLDFSCRSKTLSRYEQAREKLIADAI
jgi:hypothetical protein